MARDPLANPEPLIRRVYSYVAYRIGDGPDAQDITSETFERALRGRDTYDPSRGAPVSWLIGIARRCLSDALAARAVSTADPPELHHDGELEERSIMRLTLSAALATLGEREQELIALRYGADLTARRIGEVLGMRTNAVEVALHRALMRLRDDMDAERATDSLARRREGGRKGLGGTARIPLDTATEGREE
jgi:RNA polymerase sigma-70 factor (ECF subfamily)